MAEKDEIHEDLSPTDKMQSLKADPILDINCDSPTIITTKKYIYFFCSTNILYRSKSVSTDCVINTMCAPNIVHLPRLKKTRDACMLAIQRKQPLLICGSVGCGKSLMMRYFSALDGARVVFVQISEQTDAKSLLGAYSCTEVPGQFVWHSGPLITAMLEGYWLILEDVDRGSSDLQLLLTPILRMLHCRDSSASMIHPTTGEPMIANQNFRLLMTRRLVKTHSGEFRLEFDNPFADFLERHSCIVTLPELDEMSLQMIISVRHPSTHDLMDCMLRIYGHIRPQRVRFGLESTSRTRGVSSRDLMKFCERISSQPEKDRNGEIILLHGLDCFLASLSESKSIVSYASKIAGELNLTVEKVHNILYRRVIRINIDSEKGHVRIGRAHLHCDRTAEWETRLAGGVTPGSSSPFASTHAASTLLEQMAVCVTHKEPVLLVGETGTGKTSAVQRLAHLCGRRLRVINLNQQSDSVDLLGGFKPVDTKALVRPLREQFETYFCRTFRMENNLTFLGHINTCFNAGRWTELLSLMRHPAQLAMSRSDHSQLHPEWSAFLVRLTQLERRLEAAAKTNQPALGFAFIEGVLVRALQEGDWVLLDEVNLAPAEMLDCLNGLLDSAVGSVTLVERGDHEPLQRSPHFRLFAAMNPSTDVGKRELPVGLRNRFTELFVRELDPGLDEAISVTMDVARALDRDDLAILTRAYLIALNPSPVHVTVVVRLYAALRQAAFEGLVDGVGQRPHFSLRTLCRALVEAGRGYHGSTARSLYEGFLFSFGSQISRSSRPVLDTLLRRYLTLTHVSRSGKPDRNAFNQILSSPLPAPPDNSSSGSYLCVEGYWIARGPRQPREPRPDALVDENYILTPNVRANLKDLTRVVAAGGSLPVLLQGETSVGKTSLILYLASRIGQVCYRINNHEHTDQQTYLGTYTVASATAQAVQNTDDASDGAKNASQPPLVFQEGPLVQAMRLGHWIILDELNLAPTDILEALNRVLDDNRSIFIPDTQEVVRAHPEFRLFATQNPPGLYAGRKVLSRALRNRFIELHFDPIPRNELEVILEKRCALPSSRARRLVEVMHRLQLARCNSNIFEGKNSFITLRDLFRWAERYRLATCDRLTPGDESSDRAKFFDWDTYLAEQGYLLLAGRVRNPDEARIVQQAIEHVFKLRISETSLFDYSTDKSTTKAASSASSEFLNTFIQSTDSRPVGFEHIVWTRDMRRMLVLVGNALKYKEPVLLVGDTSCGKTTVCQLFSAVQRQQLHYVNCHQYTEAADFLGGLRPIRHTSEQKESQNDGRLFEWVDGPLITAMKCGDMFLLDEISLADDAVLERLNSLLEPERRLHLTERSEGEPLESSSMESNELTAHDRFHLVATMNPGGDYGKKELSPALRNRFTEIWCPTPVIVQPECGVDHDTDGSTQSNDADLLAIAEHNLTLQVQQLGTDLNKSLVKELAAVMVEFIVWFSRTHVHGQGDSPSILMRRRAQPTIRDLIAWIRFMRTVCSSETEDPNNLGTMLFEPLDVLSAALHGAGLIFLDAMETSLEGPDPATEAAEFLAARLEKISLAQSNLCPKGALELASRYTRVADCKPETEQFSQSEDDQWFGAHPFFIRTGNCNRDGTQSGQPFSFTAPTPASNLRRLLRSLQLPQRAILLEGSPGVGKTTLVQALARASGHDVVRINLSEATEASDLLGCDLPVEGAGAGVFDWHDGPLLHGLRQGHWIILDEMNLASQSVLECLNACLDHRGEMFVPELGMTFTVANRATRIFACQNPMSEGGGRKGLPKSFLNRFTQVHLQPLTSTDQEFILAQLFPGLPMDIVQLMVDFNSQLLRQMNIVRDLWEFNLRDLMRWAEMLIKGQETEGLNPGLYVHFLYTDRMRTEDDRKQVQNLWSECCTGRGITNYAYYHPTGHAWLMDNRVQVGLSSFQRSSIVDSTSLRTQPLLLLDQQRDVVESLCKVLEMGWMAMLVGAPGCGKRSLTQLCSTLADKKLVTMCLSPNADTVELLGSLEQREAGGLFAWVDSPLVHGITQGHWVLIENAQLCSPSVLDRLNSLLEPNGELILSERGLDPINGRAVRLRPHSDFRLILAVNDASSIHAGAITPANGVSRAMRNRGVEICFVRQLTCDQLDLTRLLIATGTREPFALTLTTFHRLFIHLCSPTDGIEVSSIGSDQLLDSLPPCLPGQLKRPPVAALITAGQHLTDLLSRVNNSSGAVTMVTAPAEEEKRPLFPDDEDVVDLFDTYDTNRPITVWRWALARTLEFVYQARQISETGSNLVTELIDRFIHLVLADNSDLAHALAAPTPLEPTDFLVHNLTDLFQRAQASAYRTFHTRIIQMTMPGEASAISSSPLGQRLWLEQANLDDLIPSKEASISSNLAIPCLPTAWNEHLSLSPVPSQLTAWPDLRWFPGWRHWPGVDLNGICEQWDCRLRHLLVFELLQQANSKLNMTTSNPRFNAITTPRSIASSCVLDVAHQFTQGHLPIAWLEPYPGLAKVLPQWLQWAEKFIQSVQSESTDWSNLCHKIGLSWVWLIQFATSPVGAVADWPERLQYHSERAQLLTNQSAMGTSVDHVRNRLCLPSPRAVQETDDSLSFSSLSWTGLGKAIGDLLQQSHWSNPHMEDSSDSEAEDETAPSAEAELHIDDANNDTQSTCKACLWPLVMLLISRHMGSTQMPIRLRVRASLLGLPRAALLGFVSVLQPYRATASVTDSHMDAYSEQIRQLCQRMDLAATSRVFPQHLRTELDRPDLNSEWRSLSQTAFALTWPSLSRYTEGYGSCVGLTLQGWLSHRHVCRMTHHLLFVASFAPKTQPAIESAMSESVEFEAHTDTSRLFQQSYNLLAIIYETLNSYNETVDVGKVPLPTEPTEPSAINPDDMFQWIEVSLKPLLSLTPTSSSNGCWTDLVRLAQSLVTLLDHIRKAPTSDSVDHVATAWVTLGCLHMCSTCPSSPLDPYLVDQLEHDAASEELSRITEELRIRHRLRQLAVGARPGWEQNAFTLSALATAGLEHPMLAGVVHYRDSLETKLNRLAERLSQHTDPVLAGRQKSNIPYAQLRRRLLAFVLGFTQQFLLQFTTNTFTGSAAPKLRTDQAQRWLEVASDLAEWLTESERVDTFADIVEPFLSGLLQVLHGLRVWTHYRSSLSSSLQTKVPDMANLTDLLSNSLLTSCQTVQRRISSACPSVPLFMATRLTDLEVRRDLKLVLISNKQEMELEDTSLAGHAHRNESFRVEFRLFSLILDLLWLHHLEKPVKGNDSRRLRDSSLFMGRILAFINRPIAQRWNRAEAERQRDSAERAALFIEAASRRQRLQDELQQLPETQAHSTDIDSPLIDPDLVEEVEWRLRFPEAGSSAAIAELSKATDSHHFGGLGREDQIQQAVCKLATVETWLERALQNLSHTWTPEDAKLVHWVERVVQLLLQLQTGSSDKPTVTTMTAVDRSKDVATWRWHTMLNAHSLSSSIVMNGAVSLDPATDSQNLPVHVATTGYLTRNDTRVHSNLLPSFEGSDQKSRPLDVYRDPVPVEVVEQLEEVVAQLEHNVRQLLRDWPGQPSLVRILVLIRRIERFSVTDPLLKFLTGLEMVWQEIFEWERNAARHVSLKEDSERVAQLLTTWRKMELKCWLSTLDATTNAAANRALPIWFHLHNVFLLPDRKPSTAEDRCKVLVELMEQGTIGEFISRFRLLAAIRAAVDVWPALTNSDRSEAQQILGNVIWFYAQFVPRVREEVLNLRKPIEKELKGIVNITKWGDYSRFWSLKATVDRCKKTIHKQVKNWESALRRPVRPLFETTLVIPRTKSLVDPDYSAVNSMQSTLLTTERWLSPSDLKWLIAQRENDPTLPVNLKRLPTLLTRFYRFRDRIATDSPVLQWIRQLHAGTQTWVGIVTDLESVTRQLESTCPAAYLLRQVTAAKQATASSAAKSTAEPTAEFEAARKWYQQFTALQQRKRLALTQWFKVALTKSAVSQEARHIGDTSSLPSEDFDPAPIEEDTKDDEEKDLASTQPDESEMDTDESFEGDPMPSLGLSYRRGQRYNQAGSLVSFLSQLTGDPWSHVVSNALQSLQSGSDPSDTPLTYRVCNRLSRVLALRASLPRLPGPPNATLETVAAIMGELGGPTNVSRIIGSAEDLLNQCTQALGFGAKLDAVCVSLSTHVTTYRASLGGEEALCAPDSTASEWRTVKSSLNTIDQLIQDCTNQWCTFWSVCLEQPSDLQKNNQLQNVFGSEAWSVLGDELISNGKSASKLRVSMNRRCEELTTAAQSVMNHTAVILPMPSFLFTLELANHVHQSINATEEFLALIDKTQSECDGYGFSFISVVSNLGLYAKRLRGELDCLNNAVQPIDEWKALPTEALDTTSSASHVQMSNRLVVNILQCLELLLQADEVAEGLVEAEHVGLLMQYTQAVAKVSDRIEKQLLPLLTRLQCQLTNRDQTAGAIALRLRLTRAVFPLINALSQAVQPRVSQLWRLLDVWTSLAERVYRTSARLLTDGFCRPAGLSRSAAQGDGSECTGADNDQGTGQENDGNTGACSLTAEGVDTTGAKDVSKEMDCLEQIEGLQKDDKDGQTGNDQDQPTPEDEADGIEMPDDTFQGGFSDVRPAGEEDEKDESDKEDGADEEEEPDQRMGESGETDKDGVSKEMWASDGEDEDEEDDKKKPPNADESGGVEDKPDKSDKDQHAADKIQKTKEDKAEDEKDEDGDAQEGTEENAASESEPPPPPKRAKPSQSHRETSTVAGEDGLEQNTPIQSKADDAEGKTGEEEDKLEEALRAEQEGKLLEEEGKEETGEEKEGDDEFSDNAMDTSDIDQENPGTEDDGIRGDVPDDMMDNSEQEQLDPEDLGQRANTENNEEPIPDDMSTEALQYNPASGDLNSDATGITASDAGNMEQDQKEPDPSSTDADQHAPDPSKAQAPESSEDQSGGGQRSGSTHPDDGQGIANPKQSASVQQSQQRKSQDHGPRPTSDKRTMAQDGSSKLESRKRQVLDADQLGDATGEQRGPKEDQKHELYQHMAPKEGEQEADGETVLDSATEAQRQQGRGLTDEERKLREENGVEEEDGKKDGETSENVPMELSEPSQPSKPLPKQTGATESGSSNNLAGADQPQLPDTDAEPVTISDCQRPPESFVCTRPEALPQPSHQGPIDLADPELVQITHDLTPVHGDAWREAALEWNACTIRSSGLARQLCESLRLVLEPTKAARMRGDFRTGKRINMRKIIPYLASQFRKDKIWLRRSQPSKREYRILIAVDDSSSMSDNLCRQMTFDSLATVVTALNLLEVGQVGVCSFGESVRILHQLQDVWVGDAGPNMLARFTFQQSKTSLVQLLHSAVEMMQSSQSTSSSSTAPSQLLLILSDGVFSEDPQDARVQAAVRLARDARLFPVCLILDDVRKKHSIFDLRRYTPAGKLIPYMDTFPLPFYLVLRDATALPHLLSDALRQWFELEASFGR